MSAKKLNAISVLDKLKKATQTLKPAAQRELATMLLEGAISSEKRLLNQFLENLKHIERLTEGQLVIIDKLSVIKEQLAVEEQECQKH